MAIFPPRPRDLPLIGLRAFEAAARLPAICAAAPEISISITAIEVPPNLKRAPMI